MQIAVVEIPTDHVGESSEALSVSTEPARESASTSGLWARVSQRPAPSVTVQPTSAQVASVQPTQADRGPSALRRARASGVFPAVSEVRELPCANDVWRWVPPTGTESPEGGLRLVVFQRGATWPPFLARDFSGGVTTCIVPEVVGDDGLSGLVQRVARRAGQVDLPVTQLIWISGESRRTAPIRFVRQLAESVDPVSTVLVVQAQSIVAARRRNGRRRRAPGGEPPDANVGEWIEGAAASA
jgi:hypothetical protein